MNTYIHEIIHEHIMVTESLLSLSAQVAAVTEIWASAILSRNKIMFCGNGGSASDSQHLAGELVGRLKGNRRSLPALALGADSAVMTCIANDFGYDEVFCRQIQGLGKSGDVLVAISTSGNSENVIRAVQSANDMGVHTIGFLGGSGGKLANKCSTVLCVNASSDTARIQECHILLGHIICALVEKRLGLN